MPSCSPSAEITRTSLSRILSLINKSSLSLLFTFIASTRPGAIKKQWRKAPLSRSYPLFRSVNPLQCSRSGYYSSIITGTLADFCPSRKNMNTRSVCRWVRVLLCLIVCSACRHKCYTNIAKISCQPVFDLFLPWFFRGTLETGDVGDRGRWGPGTVLETGQTVRKLAFPSQSAKYYYI